MDAWTWTISRRLEPDTRPGNLNGPSLYYGILSRFCIFILLLPVSILDPGFSQVVLAIFWLKRVQQFHPRPGLSGWMPPPPDYGGDEENCYFEKTPDVHFDAGAAAWHGHIRTPCGCW